jgi:hypothetical protein
MAAVLTAAVVLGGCAGDGGTKGGPGADPQATHSSHRFDAPPAKALRDGERFVTLGMPERYTPQAPNGGTDEYRCFMIDPKLTAAAFLTGSQFLPQNADLVHHAIFFRLDPDEAAAARDLDTAAPGPGWTCFGNAGVGDSDWVAHWAPGADETLLDPRLGHPLPAGSQIVMQVHYNLLATGGKAGGSDQSSIRLRVADATTPRTPLLTAQLVAPVELPCAAGESGPLCDRAAAVDDVVKRFGDEARGMVTGLNRRCNDGAPPVAGATQRCDYVMEQPLTVHAVAGHMHLLGRSIKAELNPGTPGATTLLDLPTYNFDEQAIRPLAQPVTIKAGDTVRVTCTHDAGLRRQLPQLRDLPPRYVVWGEGTSDEMCLGLFVASV